MNKTSRTIHTGLQLHALIPVPGPALNFGKVTEGVYRSSYPQLEDHAFMESLGLKTIVTLVQKDFPEGYGAFISTHGIKHHVFDMRGTKKEEIPQETMESILELVQNEQNHPLLIHCNHGRHRTGCVAAIVRKHCNHNLDEIIKEYESFAGTKSRECDIKYITAYDTSISKKSFEILPRIQERNFRHIVLSVILLVIVLCTKRLLVS
ncbi:tyrosine phosphatase family-domain-containing protein [Bombardia bombarda]|uniref:diphosphoinositol-polyphosphate diphosphatase n=1 Tax=Bombardia bombarda TaxID=252184 RepID=A0AA40CEL5_9PEZI|nr:tyrosine phosphatase family-domain-containing protein [Bombardia bombarda]